MKKTLFATLALAFIMVSCSKSDDPTPIVPTADKYMSIAAGSSWNYAFTDNKNAANNRAYVVTSTSNDTTASGKTYHVFTHTGAKNEYYNITGNDYFTLQAFSLGTTDTTLENLYLKDGAAIGTSWDQNYTLDLGLPVNVIITNKIQNKGLSKIVGANTYNNVIYVVTTISIPTLATLPGGGSITTDINYYYAPKYGMIENDAKIDLIVPIAMIDQHTNTQTTLISTNF